MEEGLLKGKIRRFSYFQRPNTNLNLLYKLMKNYICISIKDLDSEYSVLQVLCILLTLVLPTNRVCDFES